MRCLAAIKQGRVMERANRFVAFLIPMLSFSWGDGRGLGGSRGLRLLRPDVRSNASRPAGEDAVTFADGAIARPRGAVVGVLQWVEGSVVWANWSIGRGHSIFGVPIDGDGRACAGDAGEETSLVFFSGLAFLLVSGLWGSGWWGCWWMRGEPEWMLIEGWADVGKWSWGSDISRVEEVGTLDLGLGGLGSGLTGLEEKAREGGVEAQRPRWTKAPAKRGGSIACLLRLYRVKR
ncbi:hypothetical protein EJ06DRAFT_340131 [Trichodelitschia bisporula]|uniref:Uncharacterized protein n=1 Tax=Trichodelitschia bisporula TaxID=703511 RepID=A0A6G1I2P2_9PEZI|nr:hypothetical protein EJ06DRAFT_340131 [Trichodelitschia bisporula]